MIEQSYKTENQNNVPNHGTKTEFQSAMVFSNVASCCTCGMQMEFVENDVIYGEDWYHGKCWKITREDKQIV